MAARLATVEGLDGLSIGRLAAEIGMSKSGLYAHFGSKEQLQLATVDEARKIFIRAIVVPALAKPTARARLEALCEGFLAYIEEKVFPGGCFFAAAAAELGARPGPVRQRVAEVQREWMELLERTIADARAEGLAVSDAAQLAYELNALLVAANTAFLLHGDHAAIDRSKAAIQSRLGD